MSETTPLSQAHPALPSPPNSSLEEAERREDRKDGDGVFTPTRNPPTAFSSPHTDRMMAEVVAHDSSSPPVMVKEDTPAMDKKPTVVVDEYPEENDGIMDTWKEVVTAFWGGPILINSQGARNPLLAARKVIVEWTHETTLSGIPNFFSENNGIIRSLFWMSAFTAFGAFFLESVGTLFARYAEKGTVSTVSNELATEGFFPTVSFCSSAPNYRCDCKLWSDPAVVAYTGNLMCQDSTYDYVSGPDPCGLVNPAYNYSSLKAQYLANGYIQERDVALYAISPLDDQLIYWQFGEFNSFNAPWESGNASAEMPWFDAVYDPALGYACWVFNPQSVKKQQRPTALEGLSVTLDMQFPYMSKLFWNASITGSDGGVGAAGTVSMNVILQMFSASPRESVNVAPGQSLTVAIQRNDKQLLAGYGKHPCNETVTVDVERCSDDCLWSSGATYCNCTLLGDTGSCPNYFLPADAGGILECIQDQDTGFYASYQEGLICRPYQDCPLSCSLSALTLQSSAVPWPAPLILNETTQLLATALNKSLTSDYVTSNLLQMRVYASSFSYTLTTEIPDLQLTDLIGAVGGTIGLWNGASALTFVEVCEVVIVLVIVTINFGFRRLRRRHRRQREQREQREKEREGRV